MSSQPTARPVDALDFPHAKAPEPGVPVEVAPGVFWLRLKLPFALNHINVWILKDGDGWTVVDTGLRLPETVEIWERMFTDLMGGRPVKRVIATHMHPDHIGLTGWLVDRFGAEFLMTRTEYLMCRILVGDTGREAPEEGVRFYRAAGFTDEQIQTYKTRFGGFGQRIYPLPEAYRRIEHGETVEIDGHDWRFITGGGHSPEHASLHCADLDVLISGDQVLPTISSNVSVWPTEPEGDPLTDWLDAQKRIKRAVPDTVLVLPGHQKVFRNLHIRCDQLIDGHEEGLEKLLAMLDEPRRAVDVFPALFKREINGDLVGMATGESMAHLNCLMTRGQITRSRDEHGVDWYRRR